MSKSALSLMVFLTLCLYFVPVGLHIFAGERDDAFRMIGEARAIARTGKYLEALNKLQEATSLADASGEKLALAIGLNNIAEIHRLQGNSLQALNHYYQALKLYSEIGHQNGISVTGRQIDKILARPKDIGEKTTAGTTEANLSEIPAETRERLIDAAMERVRNRIKAQQAKTGDSELVPPQALKGTPAPPLESLFPKSAKSEPPQDLGQLAYKSYLERVKKRIVRAWNYPEKASRNRNEGKVDLEFTIVKDGRLLNVRIIRSSGFPSLDREAIRAVRASSPFNPIPERTGLEQLSIRFTFNYTLDKGS